MLVIIPTPIGNLKDISLRQYEALQDCDVLACEDTRTTGKLINLLKRMRMKDPTLSQLAGIKDAKKDAAAAAASGENSKAKSRADATGSAKATASKKEQTAATNGARAQTAKETAKPAAVPKGAVAKSKAGSPVALTEERKEELKAALEKRYANKSLDIPTLHVEPEVVKELIDSKYYRKVEDSEDFDSRKKVLEYVTPVFEERMKEVAKNYDQERKASIIMKRKPVYEKEKGAGEKEESEEPEDDYAFLYGIDNEKVNEIKDHIAATKKRKGRGLLVSVHAENEAKRIPRLIKMMKLGFRVGVVSEAGTPSVSDPGAELITTAAESGISIESLPGPCAAIVGITASALQQSSFVFHGFLPKARAQKKTVLVHYYRLGLPVVIYESFERLEATLELVEDIYGENHQAYVGVELTKLFEQHNRGTVGRLRERIRKEEIKHKGEVVLVVGGMRDERGLEGNEDEDQVQVNVQDLAEVLNKEISMKDADFKRLLVRITRLPQIRVAQLIRKLRPKRRLLDELDKLVEQTRNEE